MLEIGIYGFPHSLVATAVLLSVQLSISFHSLVLVNHLQPSEPICHTAVLICLRFHGRRR